MRTASSPLQVGAILFPGFELLDIYGPLELLGLLGDRVAITMLAEIPGEIPSNQGPKGVADVALDTSTQFDVLLIPGGMGTRREVANEPFLRLLHRHARAASYVASICTGSALLAKTGFLDGKNATSNKRAFSWVTSQGPHVNWIRSARWVEDGAIFTSSGVSAGMDMTLGLIQRLFDRDTALMIASGAEYTWHEDKSNDPFASTT
jgi:transcriptional regulator GlxA family with amidase domain